ncbi:hypothetical protein LEP1GSC132_2155 [Leptospira kirschneri str. 200803703]|uniref:Uncharacterized protein n=2 Tax=Leptospira kirschneri TaxID=29507 RepID=A0A828Y6B2_9LEPT|nr:hypothetical protein LEP1GSC044_0903 [Leptospira kirschneri serovar Grippotyphosa str. RM52]EKO51972.1 hypothetical protein LEP1GSC131_1212 [Leptospira kirschneri str. 200802841]EKO63050.1 hypothetical protein LEP1GSC082_1542 [Leptospira kirschneri str. H2]EKP04061.1 hypothetical protein LEP1GSC018_4118 [Leptospira kirschneri str. 2008720114]EKQ83251.1 hypothetical protein LEP1GSC064_1341 [Leptospira kirschneri serovar Grippotyphosa str. Moskva]EKR08072.1 hypothetical protein LEP1GSC122_207
MMNRKRISVKYEPFRRSKTENICIEKDRSSIDMDQLYDFL